MAGMELRQLEYFAAVARHRHFTRASRDLNIAQPAVSQQIKRLEAELGVDLLRRSTRSVELTEAGEILLARAHRVLAEIEAARQELSELGGLLRGRIEVGALPVATLDTPGLLKEFVELHPGVSLHLHELTLPDTLPRIRRDEIDVSFALADPAELGEEFGGRVFYDEEVVALVAADHELAGQGSVTLERIAEEPLIRFRAGSAVQRVVDERFAAADLHPHYSFESYELAMIGALASRGLGAAIIPGGYIVREGPPIRALALDPPIRLPVSLIWRDGRQLPPAAAAFQQFALERLASPGGV